MTNTPTEREEAERLIADLGRRLKRGENIGSTPYAASCASAIDAILARPTPAKAVDDWELELRACGMANDTSLPETARQFVKDLWAAYCAMEQRALAAAPQAPVPSDPVSGEGGGLTVWYGEMPETNGRRNWTAMLKRTDNSLGAFVDGFCFARSEYPDRVRYEADRMRWIIGELAERPNILAYDADLHSGYVAPTPTAKGGVVEALVAAMRELTDERGNAIKGMAMGVAALEAWDASQTTASTPGVTEEVPAPCYLMSEPHLTGYRVVLGYETLEASMKAHMGLVANFKKEA